MTTVRIGVCFDADVLERLPLRATLASSDAVILPELLDGGYAALRNGKPPHTLRDSFLSTLKAASRRVAPTIIAGSVVLSDGSRKPTNSSLVFSRGRLVHRYDKIHLFQPAGDNLFFRPGPLTVRTFRLPLRSGSIRAGIVICYDVRFPELIRVLALRGMKILFVPARWPRQRDEAWRSLLKARAIENQIFVVGCNANDGEGGYSYAFDPLGRMIFSNRGKRESRFLTFSLSLHRLTQARALHSNLREAVLLHHLCA